MLTLHTEIQHELTLTILDAQVILYNHALKEITLKFKLPTGSIRVGTFNTKNGKCIAGECTGGWRLLAKNPQTFITNTKLITAKALKRATNKKFKLDADGSNGSNDSAAPKTSITKSGKTVRATSTVTTPTPKIVAEVVTSASNAEASALEQARNLKKGFTSDA